MVTGCLFPVQRVLCVIAEAQRVNFVMSFRRAKSNVVAPGPVEGRAQFR